MGLIIPCSTSPPPFPQTSNVTPHSIPAPPPSVDKMIDDGDLDGLRNFLHDKDASEIPKIERVIQTLGGVLKLPILTYAILKKKGDIVRLLIDRGVNVDESFLGKKYDRPYRYTPLEMALISNHRPSVKLLLEYGAYTFHNSNSGGINTYHELEERDLAGKDLLEIYKKMGFTTTRD